MRADTEKEQARMARLTTRIAKGEFKWHLSHFDSAKDEAKKILTDETAYSHAVSLMEQLAFEEDPARSQSQVVQKIGTFYELKAKGGVLGKINLRIYFSILPATKHIIVLSVYKKENEGPTPKHIINRVRRRFKVSSKQLGKRKTQRN